MKVILSKDILNFDIFSRFVYTFRGSLFTLLFFGFLGLSFLNNYLNFTRTSSEIRDAGPKAAVLEPLEKLDLSEKTVKIAETNSRIASLKTGSNFSIKNPSITYDKSYISPNETGVKVYKEKFFFAHSTAAFNWIKYASEGNVFTISINGLTSRYKILKKQVLSMSSDYNGKRKVSAYYDSIAEKAQFLGKTYDVALMTCGDGTTGKDGDNSAYRTFIFAEKV